MNVHIPEDKPPEPVYSNMLYQALGDSIELSERVAELQHVARESGKSIESMAKTMAELEEALNKARPFIRRERNHGKHEQDRADATEWLAKYGEG